MWLQMLANFCSIGGNIFSLGHMMSKGLLEEYFRTFLITIYNASSLETKLLLFSDFFNQSINTYVLLVKNAANFQSFVQESITTNFESHKAILKQIRPMDIMMYANKIADQLFTAYNKTLVVGNNITVDVMTLSQKFIHYGGTIFLSGIAIGVAVYLGYKNAALLTELSGEFVAVAKRCTETIRSWIRIDKIMDYMNKNTDTVGSNVKNVNDNTSAIATFHNHLTHVVKSNAKALEEQGDFGVAIRCNPEIKN